MTRRSVARQRALTAALHQYCQQHELELANVFTDYGVTGKPLPPALAGLLDVLSMAGTYGVVVPSEHHLGRSDVVQARRRRIAATGSRLLVIRAAKAVQADESAVRSSPWGRAPGAEARLGRPEGEMAALTAVRRRENCWE